MNLTGFPDGINVSTDAPWTALDTLSQWFKNLPHHPSKKNQLRTRNVTVVGDVWIQEGAEILPYCVIEGPVFIGTRARIGPHAYIRPYCVIGQEVVIGHSSEVKRSLVGEGTHAAHFAYIGDSVIGRGVRIAAGVTLANVRFDHAPIRARMGNRIHETGLVKLGAVVGDGSRLGVNAVTMPGTVLGCECIVWPAVVIAGYVPDNTIVKDQKKKDV